ncbi:MFS transporter [Trinickia caryophylli]|uniref:Sugar phosphate permease n=1 Tax=Trinickia caryophylli TaxID=28094 RepID=A0A1X7GKI8_TRICW|nr:MFS transporter [Trinickia caryophylli]PMS09139.1 MFS transporter [Trinickia caryophylli]TRX14981.1 MFS transporter [Trinickia caryophylli]WQE14836.1 MFS transporter [Trinickia caryophylli]SMF71204.1 Sugar phosphate permease [Trinickia caryophylli]GLU35042.1 MFS transporter [Trinickia caryophylli]
MNNADGVVASAQAEPLSEKYTRHRWVVMGLIFCIWAIACADRANFGIALPYLKKEYGITNTQAGLIVSLFSFSYGFVQIPVGLVYKRLSEKTAGFLFSVFMILTSIFTGLMGTTSSVFLLQAYRVGLGLSEGPLGIGCTNVINRWFPAREKGTATALWIAASKLGPLIVPSVSIVVIELWGWREIFYVFAIPGILLAIAWMALVTNSPGENRFCSPAERRYIVDDTPVGTHSRHSGPQSPRLETAWPMAWLDVVNRTKRVDRLETIRQVFRSWNVLGVALGYGCMIGISNIFMSWIPTYLVTAKGFGSVKMGFLASAPFIGAVAGNMLGGIVSDRLLGGRRKPMMMLGALGTVAMMLLLVDAPTSVACLGATLMASGLMLGLGFAGYSAYPMGLTTKATYPAAFGIVNCLGQIGGACAPLAVGMLLDRYSWTSVFLYMVGTALLCLLLLATVVEPTARERTAPTR